MAIHSATDDHEATVVCDDCGQFEETPGIDQMEFCECLEMLNLFGWKSRRISFDRWYHYCADCTPRHKDDDLQCS